MNVVYTKTAIFIIPVLLVACGSGPSKSDAEAAIQDRAASVAALFGQNGESVSRINVKDMDCAEAGENTFDCEVLSEVNGQETTDKIRFAKLGGKWRIR